MCNSASKALSSFSVEEVRKVLAEGNGLQDPSWTDILHKAEEQGIDYALVELDEEIEGFDREGFSFGDIGRALERELKILFCSDDVRYEELREELSNAKQSVRQIGVGIAAAIATTWGIGVGILTPFVLVLLLGILKVGIGAWCRGAPIDTMKSS